MAVTRRQKIATEKTSGRKIEVDVREARYVKAINLKVDLESERGVDIETYIEKHKSKLSNSRIFYVVQAKQDITTRVFKFGFANTPHARLQSYVHTYGHGDGVKLHLLLRTKYDPLVERERSFLYILEARAKRYLKAEIERLDRGAERCAVLLALIKVAIGLDDDPIHEETRTRVEMNRSRRLRAVQGLEASRFGRG